ncbi:MAG: phosphodiester glycosidase family protein, partial [Candidatus Sericytochromatia bacterium]|nr:phosphodiester glycosidase family protein [Candidatus Sericytochromatia bacterium]
FNHSDGFPVSYVFINNIMQEDPKKNNSLITNKSLKDILPKIFDQRSELREIYHNGQKKWVIVPHVSKLEHNWSLKHSLQAGPNLLPTPHLEQEGFITKSKKGNIIRDGIASQSGAARSAIGINKNGDLILVAVSSQNKYHGMSINQLSDFMKELGCISAMGFDGGSSTTLVWKENEQYQSFVGSGQSQALINSALLIVEP